MRQENKFYRAACCLIAFAFFLSVALVGCRESKATREKLATCFTASDRTFNSWSAIAANLKSASVEHESAVNSWLVSHGESLQSRRNSMNNLLKATQDKGLEADTEARLIDLVSAADMQAKVFSYQRKFLASKNGSDLSFQMDAHSRDLYALADALRSLASEFKPKKLNPEK